MIGTKQDALTEISSLAKRFNLTLADITDALTDKHEQQAQASSGILTRIFSYIGSIFIFAGLAMLTEMLWDDVGFAGHVILTLGVGLCVFFIAVTLNKKGLMEVAVTPLILVAAVWEAAGLAVILKEYSTGGHFQQGVLFVSFVMFVQQACVFVATRITALAFTSLFFAMSFFCNAFDMLHIEVIWIEFVMGLSLCCIGYALDRSQNRAIAPLVLLVGSLSFLAASYDFTRGTPIEILFLGVAMGVVVVSANIRSRTLLIVGTLATVCFLGYYTSKYFADALPVPILLMLTGAGLIGIGYVAVKVNNKYIKQK